MKRFLLIIAILIPLSIQARTPYKRVSPTHVASIIKACRHYKGAEVVSIGRLGTGVIKGAMRIAAMDDSKTRETLKLIKGVHSVAFLDYGECSYSDKEEISRKVATILSGTDKILEANDNGEKVTIYGVANDDSGDIGDFILFAPSECTLICLLGTISMDAVSKLAFND